jgi:hypothetical protein
MILGRWLEVCLLLQVAFIDNNNILVLEKDGNVRLVLDGQLQKQPVLEVPVDTDSESGLLAWNCCYE